MSLTRLGLVIDYETMLKNKGMDAVRKIKKAFTITTIGHNHSVKSISSFKYVWYKKTGDKKKTKYMIVPRFGGFILESKGYLSGIKNNLQKRYRKCSDNYEISNL